MSGLSENVPTTLMQFGMEWSEKRPKSICVCGHSGDGANSDHHGAERGHANCGIAGCACRKFVWREFTTPFKIAMDAFIKGQKGLK